MLISRMKDDAYWKVFANFVTKNGPHETENSTVEAKPENSKGDEKSNLKLKVSRGEFQNGQPENISPYEAYDNVFPTIITINEPKTGENAQDLAKIRHNKHDEQFYESSIKLPSKSLDNNTDTHTDEAPISPTSDSSLSLKDWMKEQEDQNKHPDFEDYHDDFFYNHQFIPTLYSIVEEEEFESYCDVTDSDADDSMTSQHNKIKLRSQSCEQLSVHSFSSMKRSSTYDNLSSFEENERAMLEEDENESRPPMKGENTPHISPTHIIEFPCCSGNHFYSALGPIGETYKSASSRSSVADSAYSSREKINTMHSSIPDITIHSIEDCNDEDLYIPRSYAEKKKKRRWASFNVNDHKQNKTKVPISRESFRKRLSRKFSNKSPHNSPKKVAKVSPTKNRRKSSFRKTLSRVLRSFRFRHNHPEKHPPRDRAWSLPTGNEVASSIDSDESVIENAHAII